MSIRHSKDLSLIEALSLTWQRMRLPDRLDYPDHPNYLDYVLIMY